MNLIEIDESLLVKLAGRGAFERGATYFDEGRVGEIEMGKNRTTAIVSGGRPYSVTLRHTHRSLDGACDCPASEGFDFCKHCVALALALQAMPADVGKSDKKSSSGKIHHYLSNRSKEALIEEIMGYAKHYPALRENMLQKAELSSGYLTYSRLKKLITRVTPARQIWGYPEVRAYFQGLQSTLERITVVADQIEPNVLLQTVEYGISRLQRALETVDDSGGYRFSSTDVLSQLHIDALRRLNWAPKKLAVYLVELVLSDQWDLLSESRDAYFEIMADVTLEAFYSDIESRLDALPALPVDAEFDQKYPYMRLSGFLESRARDAGDIDDIIRLKQRIATSARNFYEIARLYLDKKESPSAAEWLEKADRIAKHDHQRDLRLWVDLHVAQQEWAKAADAQQRVFEARSDYSEYRKLLELSRQNDQQDRVRDKVKTWLREKLNERRGRFGGNAFTLAQILRDESDWQGAFDVLVQHTSQQDSFETAAAWFEDVRPDLACDLYLRAIECRIARKNKAGYNMAADLVVRVKPVFEKLAEDAFAELVARLRETHRPKRNFLAALDARGL